MGETEITSQRSHIEPKKEEKIVADLIGTSFSKFGSLTNKVQNHLISLAAEGNLTRYNSKGTIEQLTSELLKKLRESGENETR